MLRVGIRAIVDLAVDEAPIIAPREIVVLRFPLLDGGSNEAWLVRSSIESVAGLIACRAHALVACSAGMSRSPAVVIAAIALASGEAIESTLCRVSRAGSVDITPSLWGQVCSALTAIRSARLLLSR